MVIYGCHNGRRKLSPGGPGRAGILEIWHDSQGFYDGVLFRSIVSSDCWIGVSDCFCGDVTRARDRFATVFRDDLLRRERDFE